MPLHSRIGDTAFFGLTVTSLLWFIIIMIAIPLNRDQIFFDRETFSPVEMILFCGFITVALYDIISVARYLVKRKPDTSETSLRRGLAYFGILCLLLFIGEKTMIDEIGKEYLLGWEVAGEWIILYIFFSIQLLYLLINTILLIGGKRRMLHIGAAEPS